MSTQFVSKQSNYCVILKSGIEGNRILGTQPVSGIYIKFEGGIVTVKDESIAKMLREHPSFGNDFIEVEEIGTDPYSDSRTEIEPEHIMSEIKYGHAEAVKKGMAKPVKLTPAMKKVVEGEAIKMLPSLLKANPDILKGIIMSLAAEMKDKEQKAEVPEPKKEDKKAVEKAK
jgi:hypothetical protein